VQAINELATLPLELRVIFYNPNIYPQTEYEKRKAENKRICLDLGVKFFDFDYEPQAWNEAVKGLENEPERGKRCAICFFMRLKKVAAIANDMGIKYFSSTFGVSRYKDAAQVEKAGLSAAKYYNLNYLPLDFRKSGRQEERLALIRQKSIYNQDYCGCIFSKKYLQSE
jgi:predicted adenine nucleotide alpha hydrolase (AANH) superfamily ATPase